MPRKKIYKINLDALRNQIEDIEANNIIMFSLETHIKNKELLEKELDKNIDVKKLISISNSLNGVSKSINQCLTTLLYLDEESDEENIESIINNI